MPKDLSTVEALVDLVARSNVSEITIRSADGRITVRRAAPTAAPAGQLVRTTDALVPVENESDGEQLPAAAALAETATIIAPMVGVFHHGEPPVTLGSAIAAGQIVGAIESMKLMNDVRAESSGAVIAVDVEAGMAVEYGQPLFTLSLTSAGGDQ